MDLYTIQRQGIPGIVKRVERIGIVPPEIDDNPNHARQLHFGDRTSFFVSTEFAKSIRPLGPNSYVLVFPGDEKNKSAIYGPLEKGKLFSDE